MSPKLPRTPGPASHPAGFTLLELVLAMTALAMVAAICYGAFHLGIRAVQSGEVAVLTAERLRIATDVLIRQVKSVVPYCARNPDDDVFPHFVGTATSMGFVTSARMKGGGGMAKVVYHLEDNPPRLMMEESGFFSPDALGTDPVDQPDPHAVPTILLDGFRSIKFEYLMNDGADTEWRDAWDGHAEEMIPSAVRVSVSGLPGIQGEMWSQEIPIMATSYGENQGECDDDALQPRPPEGTEGDGSLEPGGTGGGAGGGGSGGHHKGKNPDDDSEDD
jgi:prepilin-type N-terminal cleavage/methylation domain-containing protein